MFAAIEHVDIVAAVDAHRASPHFQQYAVGGLYQLMKERATETLDAIV